MKASYNELIITYESNYFDILRIIGGDIIALEAETPQPTANTTTQNTTQANTSGNNAPGADRASAQTSNNAKLASSGANKDKIDVKTAVKDTATKVANKVKALLDKIRGIISALALKLKNRLRLVGTTDKGFLKMYYSRKSMVKPYDSTKVVSYQYNNAWMEKTLTKLLGEVTLCIDKLRIAEGTSNTNARISQIVSAPQGQMLQNLFSPYMDKPENVTVTKFISYATNKFRGEKKELIYRSTQLPLIEKFAISTKDVSTRCENYIKTVESSFNRLKSLEYQIRRNSENQRLLELISQNVSKAAILYNAYSALVHTYFELKLEQSLNYRQLLKRFYQF